MQHGKKKVVVSKGGTTFISRVKGCAQRNIRSIKALQQSGVLQHEGGREGCLCGMVTADRPACHECLGGNRWQKTFGQNGVDSFSKHEYGHLTCNEGHCVHKQSEKPSRDIW